MGSSTISLGLGLGGGKASTISGRPAGGGAFANEYSVDFDGTNDYCEIGSVTGFTLYGASLWFKPDATVSSSGDPRYLIALGDYDEGICMGGDISSKLTNEIIAVLGAGGNYLWGYESDSATISTAWHHLAITWNSGSSSTSSGNPGYDIYLDGVNVGNGYGQWGSSPSAFTCDFIRIGAKNRSSALSRYFTGLIDEVAVFSSALSSSDITAIYNSGTPADLTDYSPVGWYRMGDNDGGTGTTITDQGSAGDDGTLINGPAFSSDVPSA